VALAGWATGITISVVACPLVLVLVRRLPDGASRPDWTGAMPLVLDLVAAALRAGQPVEAALVLAAPAAGDLSADLLRVAGLLRLGAEPGEAWRPLAARPALAPVAVAASRSSTSGLRLASGFEQVAAEMRAEAHAAAEASAARTGVFVLAPLALCFLPAFVCLGIVPAIVGIGSGVLSTVR
jgi:pilus assembly protein TadC